MVTIQAPKTVRRAIRQLIPLWQTDLEVQGKESLVRVPVTFKRRLFQGDSLSPLLFCLAISPISAILREGDGYESSNVGKITHLFYMDDLKLYEGDSEELEATLELTETAARAVGMDLGAPKCGVAHFRRGKVTQRGGVATRLHQIQELKEADSYRYLGVEQLMGPRSKKMRQLVKKEYYRRVRSVWARQLNGGSKVRVHNTVLLPVLCPSHPMDRQRAGKHGPHDQKDPQGTQIPPSQRLGPEAVHPKTERWERTVQSRDGVGEECSVSGYISNWHY